MEERTRAQRKGSQWINLPRGCHGPAAKPLLTREGLPHTHFTHHLRTGHILPPLQRPEHLGSDNEHCPCAASAWQGSTGCPFSAGRDTRCTSQASCLRLPQDERGRLPARSAFTAGAAFRAGEWFGGELHGLYVKISS